MTSTGMGTEGKMATGFRRVEAIGAIVLAAVLALSVFAAKASAEPLSMTFTDSRANVGVQLADEPLFTAPDVAPFSAQIDPASGAITDGELTVPQFSTFITEPLDADVAVDFEIGVINGGFSPTTGALVLSGTAGGTLTADGGEGAQGTCNVTTVPAVLTLSTTGNSGGGPGTFPRFGSPFTAGLGGGGAIAGQWTDMNASPVNPEDNTVCNTVDERIGGPGGVWLQHQGDIVPPAAPQLTGTDPGSPNPSGSPRIRGSAEAGSTVRVYAGASCTGLPIAAGTAAELAAPGIAVGVGEGVTASFSATATDIAGNVSGCSAPISYARTKPVPPPPACVVPKLVGKTLKSAKKALKAANCKLGEVTKPKQPKGKKGKGKKRRVLVVKSSSPGRGARPADRTVDLKLGPKPKPKAKPKKTRR